MQSIVYGVDAGDAASTSDDVNLSSASDGQINPPIKLKVVSGVAMVEIPKKIPANIAEYRAPNIPITIRLERKTNDLVMLFFIRIRFS